MARRAGWPGLMWPTETILLRCARIWPCCFPGSVPGQAIADRLVDNGDEPHAIDRYLNTLQTGSALGDVLN